MNNHKVLNKFKVVLIKIELFTNFNLFTIAQEHAEIEKQTTENLMSNEDALARVRGWMIKESTRSENMRMPW